LGCDASESEESRGSDPKAREAILHQLKSWAALRTLHPSAIDFDRVALLREASREQLDSAESAARMVL
jgi:hypothetical protein